MDKIKVLELFAGTGSWGKPYQDAGYKVYNITLPEYNILDSYIDNNVIEFNRNDEKILQINIDDIYGILAAPPCTMFSFARTAAKIPRNLHQAMETVIGCLKIIWACTYKIKNEHQKLSPLKFWALENPFIGSLKWFLGKPAMVFQPYEFGHPYKKRTALWGNFNEPKKHIIALTELTNGNHIHCYVTD